MKKLLGLLSLCLTISTSYGQYVEIEGSFSKTYERLRGWKSVDGDWIYDNGSTREWKFIFNVDFYSSEGGDDMFGTVMVNDIGEARYFCNYIGKMREGEDDLGTYNEFDVDILSFDDEDQKWRFWESGILRHYGQWTYMYLGYPPHKYYFSYFGAKDVEN